MATIFLQLIPEEAEFMSSTFPQFLKTVGTNFPVSGLAFDAALEETAYWKFIARNYGSGNLTLVNTWYADTATSGNVVMGCRIAAITPNVDTTNVETKAFASQQTVTTAASGSTQALVTSSITISNLDSLANADEVFLEISRVGTSGSDTMTGDLIWIQGELSWSDT